jgi:hypothetical protein
MTSSHTWCGPTTQQAILQRNTSFTLGFAKTPVATPPGAPSMGPDAGAPAKEHSRQLASVTSTAQRRPGVISPSPQRPQRRQNHGQGVEIIVSASYICSSCENPRHLNHVVEHFTLPFRERDFLLPLNKTGWAGDEILLAITEGAGLPSGEVSQSD